MDWKIAFVENIELFSLTGKELQTNKTFFFYIIAILGRCERHNRKVSSLQGQAKHREGKQVTLFMEKCSESCITIKTEFKATISSHVW